MAVMRRRMRQRRTENLNRSAINPQSTPHEVTLLLGLISLLSTIPFLTLALPSQSPSLNTSLSIIPSCSALVRRGGETITEYWDQDPKHRGTLHCFTTGTWLTATFIARASAIRDICGYSSANNDTAFTYQPFSNGSYPHEYIRAGSIIGKTWVGFEDVVWYDMQLQGKRHARYGECKWVIEKIVLEGCPMGGNTGDASQGGWFQFEDDGTTYGVDPTFESNGRGASDGQ
ncbi:MAG: hypothetical protein Q9166_001061 [cf. Caloplaca sp. 2 TL-2023]